MADFFLTCGHFFLAAAVHDIYLLRAKALRGTRCVHRHIACANDSSLLANVYRCRVVWEFVSLHQVYTRQKFVGGIYAVEVFAVDLHKVRQTGTGTNINSAEAFLLHQLFDGEGAADNSVNYNFYAQLFQCGDFMLYDFLGQTELRNTVHQHTACSMQRFVHGYIIAHFCQIAGAGQTAGTAAYYGNLFALAFCRSLNIVIQAMLARIVGNKALQATDSYRLALDAQHAFALALVFLRADTSADSRQGALLLKDFIGLGKVFLCYLMDKLRNININRAAAYTTRFGAVQATLCLVYRHFLSVAKCYLLKVFVTHISRLFRHSISHSSTHLQ